MTSTAIGSRLRLARLRELGQVLLDVAPVCAARWESVGLAVAVEVLVALAQLVLAPLAPARRLHAGQELGRLAGGLRR